MSILESATLGLIQGITEFLPISSSAHLVLLRHFLNLPLENTLAFDVMLHLATLIAILICFKKDLKKIFTDLKTKETSSKSLNLIYAIVAGSIPTAIIGFYFSDIIENVFRNPIHIAYALIGGSILFFIADKFVNGKSEISILKGFIIGIFQSLSFMAGFSRSGSTISGGLIMGLSREESIRFSFLLGVPAVAGAGLKILLTDFNLINNGFSQFLNIETIVGFMIALLSGLWAVNFLVKYLSKNSFKVFIIYRVILALIIFLSI